MQPLPFRQVHLDFHTSEAISDIGTAWDKEHFQQMLRLGHVNSITVFSKCHHGWSYHPTQVPNSRMHPHLTFDLLGAMIEAAHEIGVKTPVYLSAGLDEKLVATHTHWLRRLADGSTSWVGWLQPGYHEFCMRSPYLDYLIAQTEEVVRNYDADGIFLDIVGVRECACQYCIAEMRARGWNPQDPQARQQLAQETHLAYGERMREAIHAIKPGLRIFHNAGHITRGDRTSAQLNTHLEVESLPTGLWGYDHFPLSARYVQGLGMDFLGMTGKFHTSWGEFGGYKHPNALRYEAALALANGAKISVGDQMHPFGKLEPATYRLIGEAFAEVEAKEVWCQDVESVADVAVLSLESVCGLARTINIVNAEGRGNLVDTGVVRVLQEGHILYDIIDSESDFSRYTLLILPDEIPATEELQQKIAAYLQNGGKVFATGASMLDTERGEFLLDYGVQYLGEGGYNPIYVVPRFSLPAWEETAFVMYASAKEIAVTDGTVLADRQDPFFNRDYLHFCSHQHAPNTTVNAGPVMVQTADTVYLAFPAFQAYAEKGQTVLREIILQGIRVLLPSPTLVTNLPSQGIQTLIRQPAECRTIVHLLYASPSKRGQGIEVIEDIIPLREVTVALRVTATPTRVYLAPQQEDVPFTIADGILHATIAEMRCHQMLVVE